MVIQDSDVVFKYTTGTSTRSDITDGADSAGGALDSSGSIPNSTAAEQLNNLWPDVDEDENVSGVTYYRVVGIVNTHASLTAYRVKVWMNTNPGANMAISLYNGATAATEANFSAEIIANQTPTSAQSGNLSFDATAHTTKATALDVGDLDAGEALPIFLRLVVNNDDPSSSTGNVHTLQFQLGSLA